MIPKVPRPRTLDSGCRTSRSAFVPSVTLSISKGRLVSSQTRQEIEDPSYAAERPRRVEYVGNGVESLTKLASRLF